MTGRLRPGLLVAGPVLVAGLLAACSSSSGGSTPPTVGSTSAPAPSTSAPVTTAPPTVASTSTPAPTTSAPATTAPASTPPASASSSAAPRSTCTDIGIRVIRGSAVSGREFAALQFTNNGASACDLYGYAAVTLQLNGKTIGSASLPSGTATSHRHLAPGETAESQLNDYTDCQAPLSDTIHVQAPGSDTATSRPGQLRACRLRVSPLGAPE
jgi:hypothetical protein